MENHIVCIASEFKGNEVLEEAKKAGWMRVARNARRF